VPPFPAGSEVALPDGRRGVVISTPEHDLHRPLVRIALDPDGEPLDVVEVAVDAAELELGAVRLAAEPEPAGV
jgi:hypothetical protein